MTSRKSARRAVEPEPEVTGRDDTLAPTAPVATVLALQRSAGNAAVGGLLQRWPMPAGAAAPKVVDHTADDKALRGFAQAEDWPGVAGTLWHYDDARERAERIGWLSLYQTMKLAEYLRPGGRGGTHPDVMRPAVEDVLRQKLDQVYPPAVKSRSWSMCAVLLNAYDEPDVLPRARQIQQAHGDAGIQEVSRHAAMMLPAGNLVLRALAFLPLESQTGASARPTSQPAMNERTAVGPAVNVPGGNVSTYDNAGDVLNPSGWTALAYEGADAPSTGWLQFAAREAAMYDAKDTLIDYETRPSAPIAGQSGRRMQWGKPSDPHWHLDARSDDVPFYEAANSKTGDPGGAHVTLPSTTAIYDLPDPAPLVMRAAFSRDPRPAKVVDRVKLHSYLVRGMEVLYENLVIVEFTSFSAQDTPQRHNVAGVGHEVGRLLPVHQEALLKRFPAWTFYASR